MKISVVTISYNQAKFLRQCIDSVLRQNYPSIEYIIVDPGSTDGSRDIIDSYGDRIIRVYQKDSGPSDGLNKGFSIATGDIFYFINSDDYVLPGTFLYAANEFIKIHNLDFLLGAGVEVDAHGVSNRYFYPSSVSPKSYVNGAVTFFQQGMFFKAQTFRQVVGFNSLNKTCWDGELLLSFLLKNFRFKRTMKLFAVFRIYPESITGSQRLSVEFSLDKNRLYKLVYGLESNPNKFIRLWYRFRKVIIDPRYTFMRIFKAK